MWFRVFAGALLLSGLALAQPSCPPTAVYSACELVFDLDDAEAKAHPNPYVSVDLKAEFRSPRHRTLMVYGFWDGGRRMVIRFAPNESGDWEFRITSNLKRFEATHGTLNATASEAPGFLRAANVHHWAYTDSNKAHLWMGDTNYEIATMPRDAFTKAVDTRAQQKFTHIRGFAVGPSFTPDQPDTAFFRELDERVRYMNQKGIVYDMILARTIPPQAAQRDRYVRYMAGRYGAFNVTWLCFQAFEDQKDGRTLTREIGLALKRYDPYQHPRSTGAKVTSSPLAGDGWMDYISYQSSDEQLGSIEHQIYAMPFVNTGLTEQNADTFRRLLWNNTMNGQYPTSSVESKQMSVWFDFFADTRHWELEPYFDVDGGRAIALEGVEYVLYVEKPGPVEVRVERHGYDVLWLNPISGETIKLKNYKGEKFAAEPPEGNHEWVLYLSREGKKESMLGSYKFESRLIELQEVEQATQKLPFTIVQPAKDTFSIAQPPKFEVKLRRETRATRSMMYLWTGDVVEDGQGFRVLGTGREGVFRLTPDLTTKYPANLNVRLVGMNANGKVYMTDKIYTLNP
jgi:hypothetical protein